MRKDMISDLLDNLSYGGGRPYIVIYCCRSAATVRSSQPNGDSFGMLT